MRWQQLECRGEEQQTIQFEIFNNGKSVQHQKQQHINNHRKFAVTDASSVSSSSSSSSSNMPLLKMIELGEDDMSKLSKICTSVGLHDLFMTSMKIYNYGQEQQDDNRNGNDNDSENNSNDNGNEHDNSNSNSNDNCIGNNTSGNDTSVPVSTLSHHPTVSTITAVALSTTDDSLSATAPKFVPRLSLENSGASSSL